ncbi:TetR/AcrR family transcriptional regulator [Streptomyces sp. TLI_171]|uniref:TetR/AcrR family transcriptional regulator n=1 Tax=Streptomyces sp. TLI_171 TaxID=1938859 RepID=UPI000C178C23|nr:TetR/AcrR family transcriptional regulator [Streptomyces sp. TLI_171]RKE16868.1 TetR family transcriptional regulator [Streptomyces sp. TLI_171]
MTPEPNADRRSERARRAILDAVHDLAVRKGYAKVTIEAIAAQAGVGKPTIYRWWPSKGAVALDALNERIGATTDFPDTGDIAADLATQITAVTGMFASDIGRLYRGIIAEAQGDERLRLAVRETIVEPRARQCAERLDRAVAAGQVRSDLPTRTLVDLFYGPVYYRFLLGFSDAEMQQVPGLVRHILAGLTPGAPGAPAVG